MNKLLLKTSVAISSVPVMFAGAVTSAFAAPTKTCSDGSEIPTNDVCPTGNFAPTEGFFGTFESLWDKLLSFVMAIGLLLVFMYLIWGGIDWITSGGDKGKTEGARNKITAAVIGLIVLAAAYAILTIAVGFLADGDFSGYLDRAGIK